MALVSVFDENAEISNDQVVRAGFEIRYVVKSLLSDLIMEGLPVCEIPGVQAYLNDEVSRAAHEVIEESTC